MNSFVDNFKDRRISIEVLQNMLKVPYQLDVLLELAVPHYGSSDFTIEVGDNTFLRLTNSDYTIFIVLSSNKLTLKKVKFEIDEIIQERDYRVIVFDKTEKFNCLEHKVYIDNQKWMNRIISHGINRQILHLQFMRDMEFYYEKNL